MPYQFLLATIVAIVCICYVQGWSRCHLEGMRRGPSIACTPARLKPLSAAKQSAPSNSSPAKRTSSKARSFRGPRKSQKAKGEEVVKALSWRLYEVEVPLSEDPGKDDIGVHPALLKAVSRSLGVEQLTNCTVRVTRKSFDGRWKKYKEPYFVYTLDLQFDSSGDVPKKLVAKAGEAEELLEDLPTTPTSPSDIPGDTIDTIETSLSSGQPLHAALPQKPRVVIVGAGPAGLFAALTLVEAGLSPVIIERGKPVEQRGLSLGALFNRGLLDPESNLCFGEGGAGTWSDGKLTTRIGKNGDGVRSCLKLLVRHGAPERILVDGKPHLGTDRLVRILKDIRHFLISKGAEFHFNSRVEEIDIDQAGDSSKRRVRGVRLAGGQYLAADALVLAIGHSSRPLFEHLLGHGVKLEAKAIAAGFRIEHPQDSINRIRLGAFGDLCLRGKGKVPVADYRLAAEVSTDIGGSRGCYSFCMCPGGQIVPTAVTADELCINGMSFSQRQSAWANSALVVNVSPQDAQSENSHDNDILALMDWQREMERRAAELGGGKLVVPVQRATDFIDEVLRPSDVETITSSYRLGVRPAPCHTIYPAFLTQAIQQALVDFNRKMPGFLSPEAIIHGVETRTSSPVRIVRDSTTCCSVSVDQLYPAGEGAGYAGGIVSAAVDGMRVADSILSQCGVIAVDWKNSLKEIGPAWTAVSGGS
eukprot:scaffold1243_cov173-Ochromonas_danica.AAC.19